ncbi:MAG: Asp-tRNA(Asn)/Glu-tRNA(Gln) amidotransferase subunit GatC [Verrucomicrobiota bacterium]|jgi:aspartyl-tRNA(Asn)/glutamyl-tRNA(Gln) amidotransferase subunit C|nr:Asp-tRNA(Asn)/Glu-tRNA(Gln) amidotransferase subunit GatC [Verrucomicrobiota bacterium]MDP6251394.1 Asp-tRNA(Asn)/Glu-tRNA(Gln) amidotransferase subunit GatC [Verrucomicrobiota bacterium]MDP7177684.1 Asp-tRNA(Asn)/Glu-tRNA(Gln) amidotransferase subunit GatC [Verrucomicrobiota bacterium]MDP7292556.1 Asp-tRNA(Asn)/Glu-tRNA(Gln) amidotransferase subunit GatC [Verrucomicrobiota bacterium]MDP7441505.1 Asp-tRNA(Asn)/Glu-tRNA(Gln) amidotransferase subunit GatC [Verrucomicrobiota bacterium]|tara:strand:+ start:591 stop:878 length:288 start_codon:yes stop_codon:yes gene_type:complete
MADNDFDIQYVANLARIALSPEEEGKLSTQLGDILGYVKKLEELDVTGVEPMAHAVPMANVLRADEVQPSISQEAALANAPRQANSLFVVPKIVE